MAFPRIVDRSAYQASSPDERRAAQSCPLAAKPDAPRYPGYTRMSPSGGAPLARPRWLMRATRSVPSVDLAEASDGMTHLRIDRSPDERRAAQSCPLAAKSDAPRYPGMHPHIAVGGAPLARPRW